MSRLDELKGKRAEVEDEIVRLADEPDLNAGESEHFDRLCRQRDRLTADIVALEDRAERAGEIREKMARGEVTESRGLPGFDDVKRVDDQWTSAALRAIERAGSYLAPAAQDRCDDLVRGDARMARYVEVHGRSEYASAFQKLLEAGDPGVASVWMSDAERAALRDSYMVRAQDEGTTTHGGFAVPVFIDPSVILTDQESSNPFWQIANVVDVNTNVWKGVSAAGVVWSFDAEGTAVSDDSITLAQPSVTVFMARGFIPYTIEVGQDWPGFSAEMARLLAVGYDELCADKFARGSGTGEPMGVITSLDATAASEVLLTTAGQFGQEDVYKGWAALPQKYESRAAWMMSVGVNNRIRQMGTSTQLHAVTVELPAGAADRLMSRPVYESAYFSDFTSTTGHQNVAVVGDFRSGYTVARRAGISVELVPHLLDVTTNRPTGSRGLFAWARVGGNVTNSAALRLINQT